MALEKMTINPEELSIRSLFAIKEYILAVAEKNCRLNEAQRAKGSEATEDYDLIVINTRQEVTLEMLEDSGKLTEIIRKKLAEAGAEV